MTQSLERSEGDDPIPADAQSPPGSAGRGVLSAVAIAVLLGVVAVVLVSLWTLSRPLAEHAFVTTTPWYYFGFFVLAVGAEIVYVPLRHGDSHEELTFFEILLMIGVLVFAPVMALAIPLAGYAIAGVILRVDLRKMLFNLGSYALSGSILILVYGLLSDPSAQFSAQSTFALTLAALVFAGVNLVMLAWILHVDRGVPIWKFLQEQWMLSTVMAIGSVGVAATVVALATYTPLLVPFVFLPAAALWYVYRSSAVHSESLERNRWIIDFTAAVAESGATEAMLPEAANALRRVFNADDIRIVLAEHTYASMTPGDEIEFNASTAADTRLARSEESTPQPIPADLLPTGWNTGSFVNLELAGSGRGAVLLGSTETINSVQSAIPWARGAWDLREVDAPVFQALCTSLGSALRASAHLLSLTEESAKLTAVVDYATDGIVVIDAHNRIQLWSPAMVTITGIPAAQATARHPWDLDSPPQESTASSRTLVEFQSMARTVGSDYIDALDLTDPGRRSSTEADLQIQRPDGSERNINVTAVWIEEESLEDAVAILTVRDMTRERRVERAKSDFIATVSHELKTPITPIKGYAQLLANRWDKMNEAKRLKMLDTIEQRADHLGRLVDDLLLSSKVSSDDPASSLQIHRTEVPLTQILVDSIGAFPNLADRVQASKTDIWVSCDALRAVQCLSNLLSNADKYSEPATPIQIQINAPEAEPWVAIDVTDRGRGIPADELEKVFERFYRVEDPMTMTTGGSGLGLFISRELARAMGGDITSKSTFGVGSTFRMTLQRSDVAGSEL